MSQFNESTDYELVSLYEQGNDEAFDVLLSRHQGSVFNFIICSVKDTDIANDVFQETFTRAIIHIRNHQYQNTGKFSAWLLRIAHNIIIDGTRRNHNYNATEEQKEELIYNNLALSENKTEEEISNIGISYSLNSIISKLPANQQEILRMRFIDDLSFKEIAQLTGVSINTALGRMRYALINLRRYVNDMNLDLAI